MNELKDLDYKILTTSRWRATPWDYSSTRALVFNQDGVGELIYGYGQTIYAVIKCKIEILQQGTLRLQYQKSPAILRFQGFTPKTDNQFKDIDYTLLEKEETFVESIVGVQHTFGWVLTLGASPYPDNLTFPYDTPLIYYGHTKVAK